MLRTFPGEQLADVVLFVSPIFWFWLGCNGGAPPQTPQPGPAPTESQTIPAVSAEPSPTNSVPPAASADSTGANLRADGDPCSRGDECESGVCEGQGCGPDEARCALRQRACTRDLRAYCGCDGETFRGSGRCPRRPFQHRGACAVE